ncbi:hypothetical protein IFT67_12420 [Sphingomonas sp. CFBP 13728]|uniref:hypothetical protein n=1 Tax=Sphingomonas sp. CFBP 13728 TaxID=2775294 RepID=UPI001785690E|nr:hypothetical protein [Sphingomonas sp. CFBP 13728]MBD8619726.1 hypothetical protein [Sphingomonas sp. CFBP 13728]
MQIDLNAFADYALNTFDFNDQFEDDAFSVEFEGVKIYCERKRSHFLLHVGAERHQLPR